MQTYQDFEIIVIDDGVKERAENVVREIGDARIRYIANESSLGACATRNKGIDNAVGTYVAFLDDDDEWLPTKLEKQVEALEKEGEAVGVAFCGVSAYDDKTGVLISSKVIKEGGRMNPFNETLYRCFIWTSAIMIRKSLLMKERFDPDFPKNQEWDLQLRLLRITDFVSVPESLVRLNMLGEGEHLGGKGNNKNIIRGNEMIRDKFASDYAKNMKALGRIEFWTGTLYREVGNYEKMRELYIHAWKCQPTNLVYMRHALIALLGPTIYERIYHLINKHEQHSL